jgi:hypothetical protein
LPTVAGMEVTIEVSGLRKRFGPAVAPDGMTFTAAALPAGGLLLRLRDA